MLTANRGMELLEEDFCTLSTYFPLLRIRAYVRCTCHCLFLIQTIWATAGG